MKPTADLHALISVLTPNEKGYFKKQCQASGSTSRKYTKLFDAIAAQEKYDEAALKKKLNDVVLVRNLSSEKNYLYHLILETLIGGDTSGDDVLGMKMLLAKAKWLSSHSFFEAAFRFARKVRMWSKENEQFTLQLDALDLEWLLWQYLPEAERRTIEEISEERAAVLATLSVTDRLRALDSKVIRLFQETGIGREESHLENYRALDEESRAVEKGNPHLSVRAKMYLRNIAVFYHNVTGHAEKSRDDLGELIALLDSNPVLKKERLSFYISSLNNLILLLLHLGRYDEAKATIALLESVKAETQNQRNTVFVTRYNTRFDLYTHRGDRESAYRLSQELKKELPHFEAQLDNRYTGHIRFAAFRSCFYAGHLKEALQWINQIVQKPGGEPFKPELLTIARICELVVHETLEHYDLLEKLVESAGRYLEKTNSLYLFEKLMLDFFHEQLKVHPKKTALLKLKEKLKEIENDLLEKRVFAYFDFREWAEKRCADVST